MRWHDSHRLWNLRKPLFGTNEAVSCSRDSGLHTGLLWELSEGEYQVNRMIVSPPQQLQNSKNGNCNNPQMTQFWCFYPNKIFQSVQTTCYQRVQGQGQCCYFTGNEIKIFYNYMFCCTSDEDFAYKRERQGERGRGHLIIYILSGIVVIQLVRHRVLLTLFLLFPKKKSPTWRNTGHHFRCPEPIHVRSYFFGQCGILQRVWTFYQTNVVTPGRLHRYRGRCFLLIVPVMCGL